MKSKAKSRIISCFLITTISFFVIHIINRIIFAVSTLKDILNTSRGNYYEWRFGKVYYTKQGNGSPVLLIHDLYPSSSSYEWIEIVKTLSSTNTVYTIDLLGCGRSEKPNLTYTNFLYVQLISDFIKNVIQHKTDAVVSGRSGSAVLLACNNNKELFNKIILINPDSLYKLSQIPTKRTKALKFLIELPILGTLIYHIIFCKQNIKSAFHNYYEDTSRLKSKHILAYYESAHLDKSTSKYLFACIKGCYTNMNIIHSLKEINNSIMIIGGGHESQIETTIDNYCYYNPSIESIIIENTKHLPQLESPDKVIELIKLYLFN